MTTDIARLIGKLTDDIVKLQRAVSALRALGATERPEPMLKKKRKGISAEARKRMSEAAKARWVARNATTTAAPVEIAH